MQSPEKAKILNTLERVLDGEPLTIPDIERFVSFLSIPVNISTPNQDEVQAALFATRQVLRNVWFSDTEQQ
jgi:hypothetical protein